MKKESRDNPARLCSKTQVVPVSYGNLLERFSYLAFYAYAQLGMHMTKIRSIMGRDMHSRKK